MFLEPFFTEHDPLIYGKIVGFDSNKHYIVAFNYDGQYYIKTFSNSRSDTVRLRGKYYQQDIGNTIKVCIVQSKIEKAYVYNSHSSCPSSSDLLLIMPFIFLFMPIWIIARIFDKFELIKKKALGPSVESSGNNTANQ